MKTKRKQQVIDLISVLLFLVMLAGTTCDAVMMFGGTQGQQYAFNFFAICVGIPIIIWMSSIRERCRPDLFEDEELSRKFDM